MAGLLKNEGVRQVEVRTLGGGSGKGQDATIILVPKGGSRDRTLAHIHLHSHVLKAHSKYFNTHLRLNHPQNSSIEFVLEVHGDVQHCFDCFSQMYPPFGKSFESVQHGLELLKAAFQIEFQGLIERISLYLSSILWTEEEEIRVREYAASPDFPRYDLKDLVVRLGLDESDEDRQKQLQVLFNGVLRASGISSKVTLPAFLEAIRCAPPSEYSSRVVATFSQAAKEVFSDIEIDYGSRRFDNVIDILEEMGSMFWILEALLKGQVAEELVQGIVHLEKIPKYLCQSVDTNNTAMPSKREFAELVLVMYKEVVAGRLVLKPPERMALLANWHRVLKSSLEVGTFEQAAADVFLTLPLKQQAELIHLQREKVLDFISTSSLASVLHFR